MCADTSVQCFREAYDATEEAMDEMDEFTESNAEKACSLYRMCQAKIVVPEDILESILDKVRGYHICVRVCGRQRPRAVRPEHAVRIFVT